MAISILLDDKERNIKSKRCPLHYEKRLWLILQLRMIDVIFTTAVRRQNFPKQGQVDSNSMPVQCTMQSYLTNTLDILLAPSFLSFWILASYSQWNQNMCSYIQHVRKELLPLWLTNDDYIFNHKLFHTLTEFTKAYLSILKAICKIWKVIYKNHKWLTLYFSYKWQWISFTAYNYPWSHSKYPALSQRGFCSTIKRFLSKQAVQLNTSGMEISLHL